MTKYKPIKKLSWDVVHTEHPEIAEYFIEVLLDWTARLYNAPDLRINTLRGNTIGEVCDEFKELQGRISGIRPEVLKSFEIKLGLPPARFVLFRSDHPTELPTRYLDVFYEFNEHLNLI